jgi:hypothetical protein
VEIVRVGYRVVLPPGWVQLPVRTNPADTLDAQLERMRPESDPEWAAAARRLRARVMALIEVARDQNAVDVYVPLEGIDGVLVPASFLVALAQPRAAASSGAGASPPTEGVAAALAAAYPEATAVVIDGAPAVRTTRSESSLDGRGAGIDYVIAIPNGLDRWLTVSFSLATGVKRDHAFTDRLVELFDAIMATFRWAVDA